MKQKELKELLPTMGERHLTALVGIYQLYSGDSRTRDIDKKEAMARAELERRRSQSN